ncbi:MAG: hypothetical protein RIQ81_1989 [Pseudomonadota bacterium]|jgi:tRNA threonylcarbamoyladenosine biosynthesis protein TsaE
MTPATAPDQVLESVAAEDDLPRLARDIASVLQPAAQSRGFCLWLVGSVGAGKTTIAGHILHALGLPARVPVLSPTYTYLQEYKFPDGRVFAHMDLYRGTAIEALEDAGIFAGISAYSGVLIEWPPQGNTAASAAAEGYAPTHILAIEPVDDGQRRRYQLSVAR